MPKAKGERERNQPPSKGLLKPGIEQGESQMPSQGDHVQMMIELLQPTGPDLARRWLAALLLVPREDREAVVESIEDRITATYADQQSSAQAAQTGTGAASDHLSPDEIDVVNPPVQHDGYTVQVRTTYRKGAAEPLENGAGQVEKETPRTENVG